MNPIKICFATIFLSHFTHATSIEEYPVLENMALEKPTLENQALESHTLESTHLKPSSEEKQSFENTLIITAQKRQQSAHKVPLAVTTYSSNTLTNERLQNISDLANTTPSFSMGQFNLAQPQLYIRGVGSNEDGAGGDSSVVVFIDGVYIGRTSGAYFDFYDIERIEILRGPQGTLYGKNVIGGAINIISNDAVNITDNKIEVTLGNNNYYQVKGLFSQELAENLFGKLAFIKTEQDGYIKSVNNFDLNGINDTGVKYQMAYQGKNDFNFSIAFDWLKRSQSGAGTFPSGGQLGNDVLPAIDSALAADPYTSFADEKGFQYKENSGVSATTHWKSKLGDFTLINAFRENDFNFLHDTLGISSEEYPLDILNGGKENSRQTSHELQLSSITNDSWDWINGIYYLQETVNREEYFTLNTSVTGSSIQNNITSSSALFSHLIYSLNTKTNLTIGARHTWDKKTIEQSGVGGFVISDTYQVENNKSWQHFTPKVSLDYQSSESTFLYASYSKGFKSGGFQGQAPTAIAAITPFDEEIAKNYEVGIKKLFSNKMSWIHLTAFEIDYQDLQILELFQQPGDPVGVLITQNAAEAKSRGLEFESNIEMTDNMTVRATYSYLDAKFTDFYQNSSDDRTNNYLRNAPRHSASLSLSYYQNLMNGSALNWHYNYRYQGRRFQEPTNKLDASIPSYAITNVNIIYLPTSEDWRLNLWVDNLFNKEYLLHIFPLGNITNPAIPAQKRTFGLTASYLF